MCGMQLKEHWEENFRTKCLNYKRQMASNLYTKIPRWETRERRANQPPKSKRRVEIVTIKVEINEIRNRKTIEKINETKSWFSEKLNETDKPLARLTKMFKEINANSTQSVPDKRRQGNSI